MWPTLAIWLCTSRCNLACRHCYVAGRFRGAELTTEEALKMVDELADLGVVHISFTGGEPLLRPDVFEIAERAVQDGLKVSFTTNAILIDERVAKAMRSLDAFAFVGLDGPDREVCDAIRGPGAWRRTIRGLAELRSYGVEFSVIMTISSMTYKLGRKHVLFCEAVGASEAILLPLIPAGRAAREGRDLMPDPGQVAECMSGVEEAVEEIGYRACVWCAPFVADMAKSNRIYVFGCSDRVMDISPQGDVLFCDTLDFRVANVREGVEEAWRKYEAFRDQLLADRKPNEMEPCRSCPIRDFCQGGCLARAILMKNDLKAPDPLCPRASSPSARA